MVALRLVAASISSYDTGMNSFNHYAYGCVMEWLFAATAGMRPDGKGYGFRHLNLMP